MKINESRPVSEHLGRASAVLYLGAAALGVGLGLGIDAKVGPSLQEPHATVEPQTGAEIGNQEAGRLRLTENDLSVSHGGSPLAEQSQLG